MCISIGRAEYCFSLAKAKYGFVHCICMVFVTLCWWINLKISYINSNNLYSVYTQLQYHSQEWSSNEYLFSIMR